MENTSNSVFVLCCRGEATIEELEGYLSKEEVKDLEEDNSEGMFFEERETFGIFAEFDHALIEAKKFSSLEIYIEEWQFNQKRAVNVWIVDDGKHYQAVKDGVEIFHNFDDDNDLLSLN